MVGTSIAAFAALVAVAAAIPAEARPPGAVDRAEIFGKAHVAARAPSPGARGVSTGRGYDVEHYDFTIEILDGSIAGTVVVAARAMDATLADVVLDLHDDLATGTVTSSHGVAATSRADDFLTVTLATPVAAGEVFTVTIPYDGVPPSVDGPVTTDPFSFGTHGDDDADVVWSLSVPWRSGAWWPCKEELSDRATIDLHVTVADTLVAASNGLLTQTTDLGDGRVTYDWSHGHPISPYLVMVAVSNYVLLEDSVDIARTGGPPVTVPLDYYVYPEKQVEAEKDFVRMPQAMQHLSTIFGIYPFADEKFAMALVPFSGGMEHQTCVSLGSRFVRGDLFYEWVFVHELAHHWWGDHVTLSDWRDVWLNEGFATYTEALWEEHVVGVEQGQAAGTAAYHTYMGFLDVFPPPVGTSLSGRIYDPSPLYGEAPYNKGAWVLHMLRWVVGDEILFGTDPSGDTPAARGVFREWAERFGGLSAPPEARTPVTTDAFVRVVKDVLTDAGGARGMAPADTAYVTTFFDQWIHERDRPIYRVSWASEAAGSGYTVAVGVEQTQSHRDVYVMPVAIEVELEGGEYERVVVMNTERSDSFTIDVARRPLGVTFDPDRRLLRNVPVETSSVAAAVPAIVPNPAVGTARISYFLGRESRVDVRLYDGAGRLARTLDGGTRPAGRHVLEWDGTDDSGKRLGSGVYFVELETSRERRTDRFVFVR